jgi:NDP-sugar pyrophosphorylase family protein
MILAGGLSTRLYPLTRTVPKPLVPIAGEPNTAHVMRYLRSFGIQDVAMNVHYFADDIKRRFGDGSAYGVRLRYLDEPALMGSAGAVKPMEGFFEGTFVVIGCDDLTNAPLDRIIDFHRQSGAIATIGLVKADDVTEYGVVILDDSGKIVEFQEKPPKGTERSHLVNTGIYVFEPEILERIPSGEFYDFGKNVFPGLQQDCAPFYGLPLPGAYWCDIGTPSEYRRATNDVLTGRLRLLGDARTHGIPRDAVLGAGVEIEGEVRIGSRTHIGDRVRIIGPSVLGDDIVVGNEAVIERSILWDDVAIGAGALLRDSIVGIDYRVDPGARLVGEIVANEPEPVAS